MTLTTIIRRLPVTDLKAQFEQAAQDVQKLPKKPDDKTLLNLYAFYKQATTGDVQGARPMGFDMVGKAKYDAWAKLKGTSRDMAMQAYVEIVRRLQGA
jgi:acyl-CoA-binding protein